MRTLSTGRRLPGTQAARLALAGSVALTMCHFVQSAGAQPTTSPVFHSDYYVVVLGEPERIWRTGPVEHMRGLPFLNVASSGDFEGSLPSPAVGDSDINAAGNGVTRGEIEFHSSLDGYEGIFIGRYAGRIRDGLMYAKGVYHGVGPMEGVTLHIRLTFDYVTYTGELWVVFRGAPLSD